MVNTATSFIQSVLTFYILYRYTFQQNKMFEEMSMGYIQFEIYHLTLTVTSIYIANLVAREVNNCSCVTFVYFDKGMNNFINFIFREKEHVRFYMTLSTDAVTQT